MTALSSLVALGLVTACGDKKSDPLPDVEFAVTVVNPPDGDEDVFLDQTVKVTFSKPLDRATVDGSSFRLVADGVAVQGRLLPDRQTVQFVPIGLASYTEYAVQVAAEVTDASGTPLEQEHVSTFITGDVDRDGRPPFDAENNAPFDGRRFVNLTHHVEYVLAGAEYVDQSVKNLYVIDPIEHDPRDPPPQDEELYSYTSTHLGVDGHRCGAAGNLDDDADEEVVILVKPVGAPAVLLLLEPDGDQVSPPVTLDATVDFGGDLDGEAALDLALGDVDGDGRDEIVITAVDYGSKEAWLYVFDDKMAGHAPLLAMALPGLFVGGTWTGVDLVAVEVGDVDGDPMEEIVLAMVPRFCEHSVVLMVVKDPHPGLSYADVPRFQTAHSACGTYYTGLALADLDGEGRDEIVLANRHLGWVDGECKAFLYLSSLGSQDGTFVELSATQPAGGQAVGTDQGSCDTSIHPRVVLLPLQADDDGPEELLVEGLFYEQNPATGALEPMGFNVELYKANSDRAMAVAVGDVDGDGRDEVITLSREARIKAHGIKSFHVGYDINMQPKYEDGWVEVDNRWASGPPNQSRALLVAANLDRDSVVIQPIYDDPALRTVAHQRVPGADQIVSLVAAPPCYDASWQEESICQTSLGSDNGIGITAGASIQVTTGVAIGMSADLYDNAVGARVGQSFARKVLLELRETGDASPSRSGTTMVTETARTGDDLVVFYLVPHHQYRYEIVAHPDLGLIGSTLSVNVPMAPRIVALSRTSYNLANGDQLDVGQDVLGHIAGEPLSFPGLGDVPRVLGQFTSLGFTAPAVEVPRASGANELLMTFAGELSGDGIELLSNVAAEYCDRGFCAGVQAGVESPVYATSWLNAGTAVISLVGAVDADDYDDNRYEYGLFAYLGDVEDADTGAIRRFVVVNYYVD